MKRINIKEKQSEALGDSASTATENSTAVVSLYNSWTASECASLSAPAEEDEGVNIVEHSPAQSSRPSLLEQLKKRCREEDLPAELKIRPRQRPNCVFLNYLGRSRERASQVRSPNVNCTANNTSSSLLATADDPLLICGNQIDCLDDYEDYLDADLSLFDEL